jgi:hypothetical protein
VVGGNRISKGTREHDGSMDEVSEWSGAPWAFSGMQQNAPARKGNHKR